ncbi:hypothetical protein N8000_07385 [Rhodospirillales bacterium]|nr:hypothetical protein [Rhodospirillales bacterium]
MPTVLQLRRGTTSQNDAFTGTIGELVYDSQLDTVRIHDGSTAGGFAMTQNAATQTLTNKTLTSPTVTTAITLNAQGDVRFADSDSTHYVAFQAPATVSSNVTWTLPAADATSSGYALVSDSSGTLSWAAAGATVAQDNSTDTAFNIYFNSTTSGSLSAVKYDGGTLTFNPSSETLACTNIAGTSSSAKYADLAEIYEADCELEAGDVVKIGGEKEITICDSVDSMFGVISTAPGFLLNADSEGYPVALKGRVPVKVKGPLTQGQRVILSDEAGIAAGSCCDDVDALHVIGRAIAEKTTDETELWEIILT